MKFISYAQNFEDVMLWRALKHIAHGFYIDVGANDPSTESVTKAFYERGWSGINIEPLASHHAALKAERPRDVNLRCAAGVSRGEIDLYEFDIRGWATASETVVAMHRANGHEGLLHRVPVLPLAEICDAHVKGDIHFLKIDVEGLEKQVIDGMDFGRYRPWILVIEAVEPNSATEVRHEWEPSLLKQGYRLAYNDGLNAFYVANEHPELMGRLRYPPNVRDNFMRDDHSSEVQLYFRELLRQSEVRLKDAEAQAQDACKRLSQVGQHNQQLVDQMRLLSASISWRITRPLRLASRLLRGGLGQLRAALPVKLAQTAGASQQQARASADLSYEVQDRASLPFAEVPTPLPRGRRILYLYVDHTSRCPTNTGVQRVVRGLARALVSLGEKVRFIKWDPLLGQFRLIDPEERVNLAQWDGPPVTQEETTLYSDQYHQSPFLAAHHPAEGHWLIVPEVPHINFHDRPLTLDVILWSRRMGLKNAFVFYDAIPLKLEEHHALAEKHEQYMQHLLLADLVLPISDWSSADLQAYWHGDQGASVQTIPSLQPLALPGEIRGARATSIDTDYRLILAVGTVEPRKNQLALVKAFRRYLEKHPESDWCLTLIGNLHPAIASAMRHAMADEPRIAHLGYVSEQELQEQYRQAGFTVFASVEEGFGLPILESLWHGKPCLCANFGAMAEVASAGGCLTVDVRDETALEEGLSSLIEDSSLRDRLATQCLSVPIRSWRAYAAEVSHRLDQEVDLSARVGTIYYWIDATLQFESNTGIQRVTRQLARAMLTKGMSLTPVQWDSEQARFVPVSPSALDHFSRWNGPPRDAWQPWREPSSAGPQSWLLMPELPLNRSSAEHLQLLEQARAAGLRCAAIFYDAIPWKMRDIYPPHFANAHREYMAALFAYDRVFPISAHSCNDLVRFLGEELPRPQSMEGKIRVISLPGEFPEGPRVTEIPTRGEGEDRGGRPVIILCVGTVEPRKNHETLLRAFRRSADSSSEPLQLILVGGSHSIDPHLANRVRSLIAADPRIVWEENADDARLRSLHTTCDFTVYPSVEEGFGLPILESLWYGRPCLCADFGAMLEVAAGGGCSTVDVRNEDALTAAMLRLVSDHAYRHQLALEAVARSLKSWQEYADAVAYQLAFAFPVAQPTPAVHPSNDVATRLATLRLPPRPRLSVCISTYNRSGWLAASLANWSRLYPQPMPGVEFFVCDNTSTDATAAVVKPYLARPDFRYRCNPENVGMLGNLRETAQAARGEYVWILGDDDLLVPGAIERVLSAINTGHDPALVYLNYAYTRIADARTITDFDRFFAEATPIVAACPDERGPVKNICAYNENFFTAIYTLVLRRDHALRAYSQDTSGRPFSSTLTCIPTTHYVLNHMMDSQGVWIGEPQVVVNMNVSWMKYAPLWVLERLPEVYELAEQKGVPSDQVDRWRSQSIQGVRHYFNEILSLDPLNNAQYLDIPRLLRRYKHLPEFLQVLDSLAQDYEKAFLAGSPAARLSPQHVFSRG